MKLHYKLLLVLSVFALIHTSASAQFKWGFRGGPTFSHNKFEINKSLTGNAKASFDSKNFTGFFVGPTIEALIPVIGLGLDASVLYAQRGGNYKIGNTTIGSASIKDRVGYIEVPVNLKYKLSMFVVGIYFTFGPYASFAIHGNRDVSGNVGSVNNQISLSSKFYNTVDYGLSLGGGIELFKTLQVGLSYSWGLGDSDDSSKYISSKDRMLSINAALLF